jgi:hypothetical protein
LPAFAVGSVVTAGLAETAILGGAAANIIEAGLWKAGVSCLGNAVCRWVTGMAGGAGSQYIYDIRTGQYRDILTGRFVSPARIFPSNSGFAWKEDMTLPEGTLIDRLGKLRGQYAGVPGTSISARGMAPGSEDMQYTILRVIKPITVPAGPATGGAMQYYFSGGIQSYIGEFLEVVFP